MTTSTKVQQSHLSESKIQAKLIKKLEADGYYVLKLIKTNKSGIPDILALKKDQIPYFIEVKAKNGSPSVLQEYRIKELNDLGFKAEISYGH